MDELDIRELMDIILEKKWFIIIATVVCMILGYLYNAYLTEPLYKASTTLLLAKTAEETNVEQDNLQNQAITQTDVTLNEKLVSTYGELAKSTGVINKVIENLELDVSGQKIKNSITVSEVDNTEILKISISNKDEKVAVAIANELSKVFTEKIQELYNINNVKIVDKAVGSNEAYNINPPKYATIGTIIGFILSVVLVLLENILKNTARTTKQVEKITKLTALCTIEKAKNNSEELVSYTDTKSSIAESLKGLRTNIKFCNKEAIKSIAITSAIPEEGKSWVSSNLATIFAKNGEKVLLIDADMKRGRQYEIFDVAQKNGLSELLKNGDINNIGQYIKRTGIDNLHLLSCGEYTQDSSELLLTDVFTKCLQILNNCYDIIIVDTSPNSIVTDGIIISRLVDTNLIVAKYNSTNIEIIDKISKDMKKVGSNVLGLIINQVPSTNKKYDESYYKNTNRKSAKSAKFTKPKSLLKNKKWKEFFNNIGRKIYSSILRISVKMKSKMHRKVLLLPGNKIGLDYVPKNNCLAKLHKPKEVLTLKENNNGINSKNALNANNSNSNVIFKDIDYDKMAEAMTKALSNSKIVIDEEGFAKIVKNELYNIIEK